MLLSEGNLPQILVQLKGHFVWKMELTESSVSKAKMVVSQIEEVLAG